MMLQVCNNLIYHALKYTYKVTSAFIEIGSHLKQNEVAYFIKDNGVGFDETYSHKLFNVFQRLHKVQSYEGAGVGLAIVYRIITRYGGRVWADSRINEGSNLTFYITHNT